jgi:hypothetical protein
MFPNVLSMREVAPDDQPIPWLTIFFVLAHVVLLGWVVAVVRSWSEDAAEDG